MPLKDSARIGIHNENSMLAGIEEDGVGSFGTDAMNSKELFPKSRGWSSKHFCKRAVMLQSQVADKLFQFACFLTEVAGRTDQASELPQRDSFHGIDGKQLFSSQGGDGALHVCPGGVLRQDGTDDDFKSCSAGPPILGAVNRIQCIVICLENGLRREWERLGLLASAPNAPRPRLDGNWQKRRNRHLFRKIAAETRQVKVETLSAPSGESFACPGGQVLANSQRWVKIERRPLRPFAMFGGGCTAARECSGCPSV